MSDSWFHGFKIKLLNFIAEALPESIKRHVLYELADRVVPANTDTWAITFEQMYDTLRD